MTNPLFPDRRFYPIFFILMGLALCLSAFLLNAYGPNTHGLSPNATLAIDMSFLMFLIVSAGCFLAGASESFRLYCTEDLD